MEDCMKANPLASINRGIKHCLGGMCDMCVNGFDGRTGVFLANLWN